MSVCNCSFHKSRQSFNRLLAFRTNPVGWMLIKDVVSLIPSIATLRTAPIAHQFHPSVLLCHLNSEVHQSNQPPSRGSEPPSEVFTSPLRCSSITFSLLSITFSLFSMASTMLCGQDRIILSLLKPVQAGSRSDSARSGAENPTVSVACPLG